MPYDKLMLCPYCTDEITEENWKPTVEIWEQTHLGKDVSKLSEGTAFVTIFAQCQNCKRQWKTKP